MYFRELEAIFMLLTEQELCERLKVERVFLFKCRQNGMPFIRLGSKIIRYDYDAVIAWFDKNKDPSIKKKVNTYSCHCEQFKETFALVQDIFANA